MKISNIALAALMVLSSSQSYASHPTTKGNEIKTPQQLLATQYGELQDL